MLITNEIASITILVQYKIADKTINQITPFKVFKEEQHYKAIPLITAEEKKLTGLADELSFKFKDNEIVPKSETSEVNLNAIVNIAGELRILRIV